MQGGNEGKEGRKERRKEGRTMCAVNTYHRLFAFISSSLISIATCAYVLLSCSFLVRIAGDPPTRFCFFISFPCYRQSTKSFLFFKKSLDLVASKLSLEVVPFWKTQANSGDHSATMFLGVFLFSLRLAWVQVSSYALGICSFCCVQLGGNFFLLQLLSYQ